ncbi:MAG: methyltransferase domain-containing protein [Pseudomonadota bacterium]
MATEINASKYRCPKCGAGDFAITSTRWRCAKCGEGYSCTAGIPRLFLEERLGAHDRKLRDTFYDGLFGRLYQFTMPLIVMPVRPLAIAWPHWLALFAGWLLLIGLAAAVVLGLIAGNAASAAVGLAGLVAIAVLLRAQPWMAHLLWVAAPVWVSVNRRRYEPPETFAEVHERVLAPLRQAGRRLQVLDVSTGSCNSLYRHGWMTLDADYTAIDLSETMLKQGSELMSAAGVAVDLVLGDAMALPFQDAQFDVVLSYGAVNGLTDPPQAIAEMARVAKPGGVLLFLDEQMYDAATPVQRAYFYKVLSSHNVIHHCPVEAFPPSLSDVRVSQVYQFYYICTARKAA